MPRRQCKNPSDMFCYICGSLTFKKNKRKITPMIKKLYNLYFGYKIGDQDKEWAPHICCTTCCNVLSKWSKGKLKNLKFRVPMVWCEPQDHITDCYFCLVDTQGKTTKCLSSMVYPNLRSAIRPVPHTSEIPIPKPPDEILLSESEDSADEHAQDDLYEPTETNSSPKPMTQPELNDLAHDLGLTKQQSEFLASRLMEKNLLAKDVRISRFRSHSDDLQDNFQC